MAPNNYGPAKYPHSLPFCFKKKFKKGHLNRSTEWALNISTTVLPPPNVVNTSGRFLLDIKGLHPRSPLDIHPIQLFPIRISLSTTPCFACCLSLLGPLPRCSSSPF